MLSILKDVHNGVGGGGGGGGGSIPDWLLNGVTFLWATFILKDNTTDISIRFQPVSMI